MAASLPVALLCSVPLECEGLRSALEDVAEVSVGGKGGWTGTLEGVPVALLPCGMGKTNAAHALTALLEGRRVRGAVGFGIAGAYPAGGLAPGDVALATGCIYGDEGVDAPGGWISTEGIGIPLWRGRYNAFPVDGPWLAAARGALPAAAAGPFVTVSACTGTAAGAARMAARVPGALCEGMEGAAWAHVAAIYGVPFLEVRAVSNLVEDRDLSRWRIAEAAVAAQAAVRAVLPALP